MDKPEENLAFKKKNHFPFPLLCDVTRKISMAYGATSYDDALFANRITYVIDEMGIISKAFSKVIPPGHAEKLLLLI
jgi:peroxiredoxin